MSKELNVRFERWWELEGKERIVKHIDLNETMLNTIKNVANTAWLNGAYVQREISDENRNK